MEHRIHIASLQDLPRAAAEFLEAIGPHSLVAFFAPMGAGKTTFTTAVCKALGVKEDTISSPTFAIVNEYRAAGGRPRRWTSAFTTIWIPASSASWNGRKT